MIIWTFVRHPVPRCLTFPGHWGHMVNLDQSQTSLHSLNQMPIKIGSFQFLPTGLHGLCFGCCFSGPLPLRSLTNGPLFRVRFGESLVVRLYSEIGHIHLSIEAQCVTTLLPLDDCHTQLGSYYCSAYAAPCMHDTSPMMHMLCIHHGVYVVTPHKW